MNISDGEREFWRGMRALTLSDDGLEVFVGLDAKESEEFLSLTRRNESGEDMNTSPAYLALRDKHEAARQRVVDGEEALDH